MTTSDDALQRRFDLADRLFILLDDDGPLPVTVSAMRMLQILLIPRSNFTPAELVTIRTNPALTQMFNKYCERYAVATAAPRAAAAGQERPLELRRHLFQDDSDGRVIIGSLVMYPDRDIPGGIRIEAEIPQLKNIAYKVVFAASGAGLTIDIEPSSDGKAVHLLNPEYQEDRDLIDLLYRADTEFRLIPCDPHGGSGAQSGS